MFVRNLLQAGDHVTVVPAGIRLSIQYSEFGVLEKVYVGYADNQVLHPEILPLLLQNNSVPRKIPIVKGTSFVYGCLYTDEVFNVEGRLDKEVEFNYITEYLKDPSKYTFYAGYIQSYAAGINLPVAIHRWLAAAGFNVLPGYLVPPAIREDTFSTMLKLDTFPFRYPRIQSYIQFRNGKYSFPSTKLKQFVVNNIVKYTNYEGYILAEIQSQNLGSVNTDYSDVIRLNIQKGSVLLVDEENHIVDCYNSAKMIANKQSPKITCSYCGKILVVPAKGKVCCTDSHCISVIYPRVQRMLNMLGLQTLDKEDFEAYGKTVHNIVSLPDILDLDKYKDAKIKIELSKLLHAVVPISVVPTQNAWDAFCSACNNSVESVEYYLQNPDNISELRISSTQLANLPKWIQDMENLNDVIEMIEHPNIEVVASGKRFEGAPIFRDKSIYVTGAFHHGNFEDIKAIFSSYSATVYDKFNTAVDCVVVGSLHDGVDGKSIQKAKQFGIPIFEENDFFAKYEIDRDLAVNNA